MVKYLINSQLILVCTLAFNYAGCKQKPTRSESPQVNKSNYTIEEFKDLSYGNVVRLGFKIHINKLLSEKELRKICQEIISKEKKQHPHNAISFFFYLPNTDIHNAYTGGKADWAPYGDWREASATSTGDYSKHKLVIKVGSALGKLPKSIETQQQNFDFSEFERRQIFKEIVAAEDMSQAEADRKYPISGQTMWDLSQSERQNQIDKNINLMRDLNKQYKNKLAKKYGLTQEQLKKIGLEGAVKGWPMP